MMLNNAKEMSQDVVLQALRLVRSIGIEGDVCLEPLRGGANNRVYLLRVNGDNFFLKSYFCSEHDLRDRLGHEFSFLSFAWKYGVRSVPRPIGCDPSSLLAICEFVKGKKIISGDVSREYVCQALDFIVLLNGYAKSNGAQKLPIASEACFDLADLLLSVTRRVQLLEKIKPEDDVDREARDFICKELCPVWNGIALAVPKKVEKMGLCLKRSLPLSERCLSPSDFGFHNAILEENGKIRFLDFEYSGWDDPAKMVCDFFSQPEVKVPMKYYDFFAETVAGLFANPDLQMKRFELLMPVFVVKWCCIMLNEFLPIHFERRQFALDIKDNRVRKKEQLNKAREAISLISI